MITKNMKALRVFALSFAQTGTTNTPETIAFPFITINNTQCGIYSKGSTAGPANRKLYCSSNRTYDTIDNQYYCFLWVGTNETEPTENDYGLTAISSSDISHVSDSVTKTFDGEKTYLTFTRTFLANTDVVVKEVGLLKEIVSDFTTYNTVLLAREVIPNTAGAGEPDSRLKLAGTQFTVSMVVELT